MRAALPRGRGNHIRLWDRQWRLIWDSHTATTPLYDHVSTLVNATIDYPSGYRWSGFFERCPEGIRRGEHYPPEFWDRLTTWPELPNFKDLNV